MNYFPITPPFLILLCIAFLLIAFLIVRKILRFASLRMGVGPGLMGIVLLSSLVLSYINIPIVFFPAASLQAPAVVTYFGVDYVVPMAQEVPGTLLAINVGGAVIPILLSLYLMLKNGLWRLGLLATMIVAGICFMVAEPIPGVGIALPIFVPPLATAVVSLLLSRLHAAPLAYIGGSLGTLLGADVFNLDLVRALGAPVASIGGAGTFDGIFVTGLLAVIFAGVVTPPPRRARSRHGAW